MGSIFVDVLDGNLQARLMVEEGEKIYKYFREMLSHYHQHTKCYEKLRAFIIDDYNKNKENLIKECISCF